MEIVRKEILPGVNLSCLKTDKFKTACLSLSLLTQHTRETAAQNAVIPYVLRRGTNRFPNMAALSAELDGLYGAHIEPVVRRIGEIQCPGFYSSFPGRSFLPEGSDVLERVCELMCQLLLCPNTKGGLLLPAYVESEKAKLLEIIRGRINNKRSYAVLRLVEQMCCYEDYAVPAMGTEDEAEGIHYRKLTKQYRRLISVSPIEIFYCGSEDPERIAELMTDSLSAIPRGEIDYDIGTDIRMNAVEDEARYFEEELDISQSKLVMGYRLGDCMEDFELPAIYVFNAVFGGCVTSKLFENVREKLSLAYYASSSVDVNKGLMLVSCGIDRDRLEDAKGEIFRQLDAIKCGDVSADELEAAKKSVASDLRAAADSQGVLEGFYLANTVNGLDISPDELAQLIDDVTLDDVVGIANSVILDAVYFLSGTEEEVPSSDDEA